MSIHANEVEEKFPEEKIRVQNLQNRIQIHDFQSNFVQISIFLHLTRKFQNSVLGNSGIVIDNGKNDRNKIEKEFSSTAIKKDQVFQSHMPSDDSLFPRVSEAKSASFGQHMLTKGSGRAEAHEKPELRPSNVAAKTPPLSAMGIRGDRVKEAVEEKIIEILCFSLNFAQNSYFSTKNHHFALGNRSRDGREEGARLWDGQSYRTRREYHSDSLVHFFVDF